MTALSIEAKINEAFLSAFAALSLPAGTQIVYPNVSFIPDGTHPYIRLSVVKNTPTTSHIGGGKEPIRMGMFLAVVCWPVGGGIIAPTEVAATIRDAFKFNTRVIHSGVTICVIDEPTVRGDAIVGVYNETPVVIPWTVYP
jgi:hypothetical protein